MMTTLLQVAAPFARLARASFPFGDAEDAAQQDSIDAPDAAEDLAALFREDLRYFCRS